MLVAEADDRVWTVHTDVFDGPLDLLLYLVKREGVDPARLPLARITASYLEYLDRVRALEINVAADYLLMAATLVHLKSLELLPRPPTPVTEADEEDPREAFQRRFAEYARYREAAADLAQRSWLGRDTFARAAAGEGEGPLVAGCDAFGLLDRFYAVLRRSAAPDPTFRVADEGPDFGACCTLLVHAVQRAATSGEGRLPLLVLLMGLPTRPERVLTFLATLEMVRLGWLDIWQERSFGEVFLEARRELNSFDPATLARG